MMAKSNLADPRTNEIAEMRIHDLVMIHPEVMSVLAPLGIDLCCGGAHRLEEALQLHHIPREPVLDQIIHMIGEPTSASE